MVFTLVSAALKVVPVPVETAEIVTSPVPKLTVSLLVFIVTSLALLIE